MGPIVKNGWKVHLHRNIKAITKENVDKYIIVSKITKYTGHDDTPL